ncbi:MAG: hypothetical protein ACPGTO_07815 [Polaribacter sp.]
MKLNCPNCHSEISPKNINISTDLAKCDKCNSIHKASVLLNSLEKKDINPPNGSKIKMKKGTDGNIEFIYPKKGFSASLIPQLFFAIFWLGFISFWTLGASQGSIFFALFSIPFWIIGLSMIIGIINSVSEIQILSLSQNMLTIKRLRPIRPKTFETQLQDIQSIKMKGMKMNPFSMFGNFKHMMKMQGSFGSAIEVPAIITGQKTEYFFNDANDAEQEWITTVLDKLVNAVRK